MTDHDAVLAEVTELLKGHPLTHIETEMLAYYAEAARTRPGAYMEMARIVFWLEETSRISPTEKVALLEGFHLRRG